MGCAEGAKKGQSWAKKPDDLQWDRELLGSMRGVPWEPIPGRGMIQIKSKTVIPGEVEGEGITEEPLLKEMIPRRVKITKYDLSKYGFTAGCPGCIAANRGLVVNHSEKCRKRIEQLIEENELERTGKARERIEERQKKRKRKMKRDRRRNASYTPVQNAERRRDM